MSGKNRCRRDLFQSCGELYAITHVRPAALDDLKGCMALIQMPDRWFDAKYLQRTNPTDAEHDLLHDAGRFVAAIETMCDRSVCVVVMRKIAVEQKYRGMSGAAAPDSQVDSCLADWNRHTKFPALGVDGERKRKVFETRRGVLLNLTATCVDVLFE